MWTFYVGSCNGASPGPHDWPGVHGVRALTEGQVLEGLCSTARAPSGSSLANHTEIRPALPFRPCPGPALPCPALPGPWPWALALGPGPALPALPFRGATPFVRAPRTSSPGYRARRASRKRGGGAWKRATRPATTAAASSTAPPLTALTARSRKPHKSRGNGPLAVPFRRPGISKVVLFFQKCPRIPKNVPVYLILSPFIDLCPRLPNAVPFYGNLSPNS